jgi:hypothetical protein
MDKKLKDILHSYDIQPPKGLKQAVFQRIEKEKTKSLIRKRWYLRAGFVISGSCSIAAIVFLGKEILASEFFAIASLGLSDMKTVASFWQNYVFSLLETLPTVSLTIMLLPVFIFMLLLRQYGKLQQYTQQYSLKH